MKIRPKSSKIPENRYFYEKIELLRIFYGAGIFWWSWKFFSQVQTWESCPAKDIISRRKVTRGGVRPVFEGFWRIFFWKIDFWGTMGSYEAIKLSTDSLEVSLQDSNIFFEFSRWFSIFMATCINTFIAT